MRLLKSLIAGAGLLFISTQAHAATLDPGASIAAEDADANVYGISQVDDTFSLTWGSPAPGSVFVEFAVSGGAFNLILDTFSGASGGARLQLRNSVGEIADFSPAPSGFTTSTSSSVNSLNSLADGLGTDAGFDTNGGGLRAEAGATGALFSNLTAGTYFLGFQNTGEPQNASAIFRIAAVPVPAAGLLFGSALMGAAALRRRKAAQAA